MLKLSIKELKMIKSYMHYCHGGSPNKAERAIQEKLSKEITKLNIPIGLKNILGSCETSWKNFCDGADLDQEIYGKLYVYFCSTGEMPYGTQKARDGDPFNWVTNEMAKYAEEPK